LLKKAVKTELFLRNIQILPILKYEILQPGFHRTGTFH
jgi:hypothetical protein